MENFDNLFRKFLYLSGLHKSKILAYLPNYEFCKVFWSKLEISKVFVFLYF